MEINLCTSENPNFHQPLYFYEAASWIFLLQNISSNESRSNDAGLMKFIFRHLIFLNFCWPATGCWGKFIQKVLKTTRVCKGIQYKFNNIRNWKPRKSGISYYVSTRQEHFYLMYCIFRCLYVYLKNPYLIWQKS